MTIRCLYLSDQHLEFEQGRHFGSDAWADLDAVRKSIRGHPELGPLLAEFAGACDIVLAAGDINNGTKGVKWLGEVSEFLEAPVLFCAGNHEFYGQLSVQETLEHLRTRCSITPGVHFLEKDRFDIEVAGQKLAVLGTTLWTDMRGHASAPHLVEQNMYTAKQRLNDYESIFTAAAYQNRQLTPQDTVEWHRDARDWLASAIPAARAEADKVVVMSHHAPSLRCTSGTSRADIDYAYASSLEDLVIQTDGWVHGHVHEESTHLIGGVPVVSSCRGYVSRAWGWDYRPAILELD
jgi:predicted phosphohydrolase